MWFLSNIFFEFFVYLIIDNLTKYLILNNRRENRFDLLIFESHILGFCIGFVSIYHHFTYVLLALLVIHIVGTLYTERRFDLIGNTFEIIVECARLVFKGIHRLFLNRSPPKVVVSKKIPQEYLYNYRLKPSTDHRLEQTLPVQSTPRPGIFNLHGTTCSLNAILQSVASLNSFYSNFQRDINLSRFSYDSIVSMFLHLLSQLRNDYHTSDQQQWNTVIDTSSLISRINTTHPNYLSRHSTTDIAELFQCLLDLLNNALAKPTSICSTNVIEQVHNRKLTTISLNQLNKIFVDTEAEMHNQITLDNLDTRASYIIQYVDLTWLMHHIQLGSIVKTTFSGQLLHAHCCDNCSHVRFRTEPFQILTLPVGQRSTTLERIISQLTRMELVDSVSCSYCSSQNPNDHVGQSNVISHDTVFTKLASTLSPLLTIRRQSSGQRFSSTPVSISSMVIPSKPPENSSRMKTQTMIGNFPSVLCLQLRRFSYDRLSQTTRKLSTQIFIEPDKILDLSHIHYTTWLGLSTLTTPYRYRLIAVCLHSSRNNSSDGHYVCMFRTDQSRWFLSDDERMTEMNQIENVFQTPFVTDNCYLLFYERC